MRSKPCQAKVNGKLTLGENIGYNGSVSVALAAYRLSLAEKAAPAPVLDGYSAFGVQEHKLYLPPRQRVTIW